MVRESEIDPEIVFGIIGDTDIFVKMKFEDKRFKKFIKESLPSHKSISQFSEYFMYCQNDFFMSNFSNDACRNSGIIRRRMDNISPTS